MLKWLKFYLILSFLFTSIFCTTSVAAPIYIVAAENFYGSVAKEIGGSQVNVRSIMSRPEQDPHLFTISPSVAKNIAQADLIVYNGLSYDLWLKGLLGVSSIPTRRVICVGELLNKKEGDNPHIWYDPVTMATYAKALFDYLTKEDPSHQATFQKNYSQFLKENEQIIRLIGQLRPYSKGLKVIATEPVFDYMARALGFDMFGIPFQISIMNGVEPSPQQVLDFQNKLQTHDVQIVFYNKQVSNPLTEKLLRLAESKAIPIIGVTETLPLDKTYNIWMIEQLIEIKSVLKKSSLKQSK